MTRAGLLHTAPALAETFQHALTRLDEGLDLTHVVDPSLLRRALGAGVDELVDERVLAHVRHLVATGVQAVLVTCSSIGEAAERAGEQVQVPVVRVDQAMAERAIELAAAGGGRVAVLATLESTLGPTERLLRRMAAGRPEVVVVSDVVAGAAASRSAGDSREHDRLVRDRLSRAAADSDVVVLAQASMAPALDAVGSLAAPVLESVSSGSARLVETLRGHFRGKC
jgi:Asp/Glu/hydantoin racemase